ncbi:PRKR-interacting protein 1, partial [Eschrichtius robustus]|nr:PRKR-interacting protein 1 [Eschrichtius robustus]
MAGSAASSVRPPRPKKEPQALVIPKNAAEEQKLKLERLMKNPDKTVLIPEKMSEWAPRPPPEFVRDVMGSSAGAGSGEFHVYRHLRRREYQRQDYMDAMAEKIGIIAMVVFTWYLLVLQPSLGLQVSVVLLQLLLNSSEEFQLATDSPELAGQHFGGERMDFCVSFMSVF